MKTNATDKADMLFKQVDHVLALPLSEYHQLKLILRKTMKTLHADRCWLMYPCEPTSEQFLIPIEETTTGYPGANRLKKYAPANPVFRDIAEKALASSKPVEYDLTDNELATIYQDFKVKSQLGCKISTTGKPWALGIHHCETQHYYSCEDKQILTEVSHKISRVLNQLLDIPRLLSAAELSTEMLDNNPLAQVIYNVDRKIVYANQAYCELNGRQLENILKKHGKQYLRKSNQHLFDTFFTQIETDGFATVQTQKITGVGKNIWVENSGSLINYNGHRHFIISSKDITAETDAINALNNMLDVQNAILEATDDGILVEDINRKIISINQNFYKFFNIEPPKTKDINTLDLLTAGIPMIVNAEEISGLVTQLAPTSSEKSDIVIQITNRTTLNLSSFPLVHHNTVKGRVWYFKNITEQVKSTLALENALDIHRAIMEASDDGLLVEDRNRKLITVNEVFTDTFKLPQNMSDDGNISTIDVLSLSLPMMNDPAKVRKMVSTVLPTSDERIELLIHLIDGRVLDITSLPLINNDNIHGRVWYFKDITERYRLTHKLSFEATHDSLTKLINRRGFDEILKQTVEQTAYNNKSHALLYLDLDRFKIINDTSGHAAGDTVLIEVSKVLTQLLRKTDSLARVGGDEFCILLDNSSLKFAERIAEKTRIAIEEYVFKWEDKEFNLGVSIGIISLDATIHSYEEALNLADTSCYLAKEEGRNCIHVHTTSDQAVMQRLQQGNIVSQIQDALKTDRFTCFVQKICSTSTAIKDEPCIICNYEVLVRMLDNAGNMVAPFVFLQPAERFKLMHKIDQWVINNSIQHMANIQDKFGWFSINLSGQSIAHEDTYNIIVSALDKFGIQPEKVCFEITETAAISNPQVGIEFLHKLQALGCKVALDDFGTGLSSYEYLKKLPADILKIDGQFIKNMIDDKLDLAMVNSINEIGHLMGKETIGEFVENTEILAKLVELGVDYAQGYHIDKPKPLSSLIESFNSHTHQL